MKLIVYVLSEGHRIEIKKMSLSALAIRGAESTRVRDRSVGENSRNLLARGEIF